MLKLAKEGDLNAAYKYAEMCLVGKDVPQDLKAAVNWFKSAADKNHQLAIVKFPEAAYKYAEECLVSNSLEEALSWLKPATEKNYLPAIEKLAELNHSSDS